MVINILKNIYDNKALIEKEKIEISNELENIKSLRKSLEEKDFKLKEQEKDTMNQAKQKAREILLDTKEYVNKIIKEMNKISNKSELENSRNELNKKIKDIKFEEKNISKDFSKFSFLKPEEILPNTKVFVTTLNKNGIVTSHISKSNEVQVQIGSLKLNVSINNLAKPINIENDDSKNYVSYKISKSKNIKSEINVIGLNIEEAIFVIDKFIDDCSISNLQNVRIIHGKGTGKLRKGIHEYLKTNPHIKSFRIDSYGEGEMGVTVVELK